LFFDAWETPEEMSGGRQSGSDTQLTSAVEQKRVRK
jgi:hypothetical protein